MGQVRSGFTLRDLLIAVALLAVVLTLSVPAIAQLRQEDANKQSINNLKQFGTAINNIASNSTTGVLPPGVDDNHFSTSAYLLPFIEQGDVYKRIDFMKPIDDKANADARKTVIKTYLSARDPVTKVNDDMGATNYLWNEKLFFLNSKSRLPNSFGGRTSATIMVSETLKGDPKAKAGDVRRQHVLLKKEDFNDWKEETGVDDFKNGKNVVSDRGASWMDGRFLQGTFNSLRKYNDDRPDVSYGGMTGLSIPRSLDDNILVGLGDGTVRVVNMKKTSLGAFAWAIDPMNPAATPADW